MGEPLIIVTASSILDDQDLSQTSSVLTIKGYLNKLILCLFQNWIQNVFLNIPLTVVENCHWQSVSPTKGSCFIIKKKLKPRKQSLKQHKTVRRYSCKWSWTETLWKQHKYLVKFSFQIFCEKNFNANCPLHTDELNQTI